MEEGSQGEVLVYTLGLEEGGEECLCLSIEVPYVRVSVRPREGSRLSLPLPPSTDPRLAPVGLWLWLWL